MSSQSSEIPPGKTDTVRPLDALDQKIISELSIDGRLSMRALAEKLHISRANAYTRVERLVADGVITGFGARLDPERAGLGTSAYIMVTIEQNTWREVSARLRAIRYVDHIALVGGDFDVLVLVRAPDNAALRHLVLEKIQEVPGVKGTRTWLVFDEAAGAGPADPL
ncbi:Lrp/AsnC family transcriptional regulator [Longispora albida]|uniref:Lrp/AsnC family transcriptional regulator n=1 Tax=Longispora albida TaxID=203523 RepID=UPI0003651C59|nr:Lrp/AsnC family transcriptional regulator [Longispora albida]